MLSIGASRVLELKRACDLAAAPRLNHVSYRCAECMWNVVRNQSQVHQETGQAVGVYLEPPLRDCFLREGKAAS